jgi:tetratricopeptide (TPR) repeat protein
MSLDHSALISKAAQAHAAGRLDESESGLRQVLIGDPENVQALLLLGIIAVKRDRLGEAIDLLEKVRERDSTSFQARLWLSMASRKLGNLDETLKYAIEATNLNPNDPQGQNQLGLAFLDKQEFRGAESCFRKALSAAPNVAQLHFGLGLAQQGLRDGVGAIGSFRRAAQLAPESLSLQTSIRQKLMDEYDPAGAADCARAILKLQPNSAEANLWLARALMEDNKATEAEAFVRRAIELKPDSGLGYTLLGSASQILGDIKAAEGYFQRSIEAAPVQGSAYLAFVSNRKMTESDRPIVDQMERLLHDPSLSEHHLGQLCYGLGKASEDLAEYERAMAYFDRANRLAHDSKFGMGTFDQAPLKTSYDFAIGTFTREVLEANRSGGSPSEVPIFVLGMMRSGTTLAEQILSSHPIVGAAGEQRFWSDHRNDAFEREGVSLDGRLLRRLADEYLSILKGIAPDKARVVDKMPVNYEMTGLIHLAFPNAKIIHTVRNPVDTCISIYSTANRSRIEWTHDKGDIAFVYEQYLRLMDHWRRVLPAGVMMDVRYEDVVSDRENMTRAMVDFCGLEWDEACLRPEQNERSVITPSVWQVRQPVYKSSMNRWKKYEPWLGELARLNDGDSSK